MYVCVRVYKVQSVWGCQRNSIHTGSGGCGIPAAPAGRSYKMPAQRLTSFLISHLTIHSTQGCDRAASGERRDKNSTPPDRRPHCGSRCDGLKALWGIEESTGGLAGRGSRRGSEIQTDVLPLLFFYLFSFFVLSKWRIWPAERGVSDSWASSPVDQEPRSTCQSFLKVQLDYQSSTFGVWGFIYLPVCFILIHLRYSARFPTKVWLQLATAFDWGQ